MAQWGIKVSQPNKDVKTCADKDLAFSSQWNTLKILLSGFARINDIPAGGYDVVFYPGEKSLTINHNLGYVPMFLAYANFGNGKFLINESFGSINDLDGFKAEITNSQITFYVENWSTTQPKDVDIYYFLLIESIV